MAIYNHRKWQQNKQESERERETNWISKVNKTIPWELEHRLQSHVSLAKAFKISTDVS